MHRTIGPVLGAIVFIVVEEILSKITIYWQLPFGVMLILVVLYSKGGLLGMIGRARKAKPEEASS